MFKPKLMADLLQNCFTVSAIEEEQKQVFKSGAASKLHCGVERYIQDNCVFVMSVSNEEASAITRQAHQTLNIGISAFAGFLQLSE